MLQIPMRIVHYFSSTYFDNLFGSENEGLKMGKMMCVLSFNV